jgi:hypothetical protein
MERDPVSETLYSLVFLNTGRWSKSKNSVIPKYFIIRSFSMKCKSEWKKGPNSLKTIVKEQQYKRILKKSREGSAECSWEMIDLRDANGK